MEKVQVDPGCEATTSPKPENLSGPYVPGFLFIGSNRFPAKGWMYMCVGVGVRVCGRVCVVTSVINNWSEVFQVSQVFFSSDPVLTPTRACG